MTYVQASARIPLSSRSNHKTIPIGTKFGFLEITSTPFKRHEIKNRVFYECKCYKCGKQTVVRSSHLTDTQSCGCITKRNGPRICKICNKSEEEVPFPRQSKVLYCSKHDAERNKPMREKARKKWLKNIEASPERFLKYMLGHTQKRKSKKGWYITINDVLALWEHQCGRCAITGIPMQHIRKSPYSISIDRIDSSKGYIASNIQLVCYCINLAKNVFSDQEIRQFFSTIKQS